MYRHGKTFKKTTTAIQEEPQEKVEKKKLEGDNVQEEKRDEHTTTQLDTNGIQAEQFGRENQMDINVQNDWLYRNMVKYFKKKNGFLNFKKVMAKVDEQLTCSEQLLCDLQHLQQQVDKHV